ncbi:MAG: aspartyl protease family protein [Bacteroidota bacterium]
MSWPKSFVVVNLAVGLLIASCKPSAPRVVLSAPTHSTAECSQPRPQGPFQAIEAADLAAMPIEPDTENLLYRLLKGLLLNSKTTVDNAEIAALQGAPDKEYAFGMTTAMAWRDDDYGRIVDLAGQTDLGKVDASTAGLSAIFAQMPPQQFHFPEKAVEVPIHSSNTGNPIIDVVLNGKSFRFWLDTGAGVSVLSSKVAEEAGIQTFGAGENATIHTSTKHTVKAGPAFMQKLQIGGLEIEAHPCVIMDKKDLTFRLLGIKILEIDGIIGWPLLKHLDLTLDYPESRLTIRQPQRRAVTDFSLSWYWQPFLALRTTNNCQLNLMLDTGSSTTFFDPSAYSKLDLSPTKKELQKRAGAGGSETIKVDVLENCRFLVHDSLLVTMDSEGIPAREDDEQLIHFDGVIGQDILQKGVFRMDFTNRAFSFSASPSAKQP